MPKPLSNRIVLPILAFYLYLAGSAPYIGQWDSFDYLKQIVTHRLSALGFGRPVFIGYNILIWESMRRLFRLNPIQVEIVAMAATVLLGVAGIVLFERLARRLLPSQTSQMAVLALVLSPIYAIYSGFVMTEVPMLVALLASALAIWKPGARDSAWRDLAGGIFLGLAAGIREQALTLVPAFLWILWIGRSDLRSRIKSMLCFGAAAAVSAVGPVLAIYLHDPAAFIERMHTWIQAIPMGRLQFWINVQASLLYTFAVCPGAWIAAAAAGTVFLFRRRNPRQISGVNGGDENRGAIPNPVAGAVCCLLLPLAALWRDADVQIHPRYEMIVLPAALIFCVSLFRRWFPSRKGPIVWAAAQVAVFGIGLVLFSPFRESQIERIRFAGVMRDSVPGEALLIAGNLSPILDYYRGIGVRPRWRILWSGWNWDVNAAEKVICRCWAEHVPVYLSENPSGWSYLESEFLDLLYLLKDSKKEQVAPHLYRVFKAETARDGRASPANKRR
jgi:hypothetical protein